MASKSKKNGRHEDSPGENHVLAQFISVTGASEEVATNMLEACNNELDMAIGMYLDSGLAEDGGGGAGGSGGGRGSAGRSSAGAGTSSSSSPKRNGGKRRSKTKSPTEDEAFEDGEEFVRAPIPQKMEQLVDDMVIVNPKRIPSIASTKVRSVFDGFRDFRREAEEQQRAMLSGETSTTNASHSSSSFYSSSTSSSSNAFGKKPSKKLKTLEELFRPPVDMLYPGTFIGAREEGKAGNLWLLINIQNHKEFACQCLNRDIWSHGAIRDIVKQHFVFWQVYHDSAEGVKYEQFYPIGQYPYVAILDPRTGERLLTINKFDALSFSETVTEFLRDHPSPDGTSHASNTNRSNSSTATSSASSSASSSTSHIPFASSSSPSSPGGKRKLDTDSSRGETSSSSSSSHPDAKKGRFTAEAALESILDESEDSQLQAAIRASLANSDEKGEGGGSAKSDKDSPSKNKSSNAINARPSKEESEMTESDEEGSETEGELETFSDSSDDEDDEKTKMSKDSMMKMTKKPEEKSNPRDPAPVSDESTSSEVAKPNAQSLDSSNNESVNGDGDADDSLDDEDVVGASASDSASVVGGGDLDGWRRWCASEAPVEATKTKIIFRLPDGARDQLELVVEAPLLALTLFANSKGFSAERFELVTNFPRKKLSYMDGEATLKAVGIIGQETVFVQEREIPLAK